MQEVNESEVFVRIEGIGETFLIYIYNDSSREKERAETKYKTLPSEGEGEARSETLSPTFLRFSLCDRFVSSSMEEFRPKLLWSPEEFLFVPL